MSSLANLTRPSCSAASSARIGSTARQGPHQGAQKSTTTAVSACRTSCSKVASVSSSTGPTLQAAHQRPEPEDRHLPDRLEHDPAAHLRAAMLAVDERDRDLDDAEAGAERAVGALDLEDVTLGGDRVEVERLEHGTPIAPEAAGHVPYGDAEQHPRVPRAAARDEAAHTAPVAHAAALHVARPEHQVGIGGGGDQPRNVLRVVREVRVHLEHELRVLP